MKANNLPLQTVPSAQHYDGGARASFLHRALVFQRRKLLRLFGFGALGLALPAAVQKACAAAPASPAPKPSVAEPFWNPAGMDAMTAIFTRRSQRVYTGEPLPKEDLQRIIAAGMNAPSAHNTQPWSFVVFSRPRTLDRIPKLIPYTRYAVKAGAAVLVCVRFLEGEPRELALLSVACCIQNMLLACHALGYGGVWLQVYPGKDEMSAWRQESGLPEEVLPLALVPIGKPVDPLPPVNRMDAAKIHYERWQGL